MNCPKCESAMRSYERNGITVDQCTGCKGIFLDKGELEHLMDAEDNYYQKPTQPAQTHQTQYYAKKKKSFLTELLDF